MSFTELAIGDPNEEYPYTDSIVLIAGDYQSS